MSPNRRPKTYNILAWRLSVTKIYKINRIAHVVYKMLI
jgi:hypothetical protein